MKKNKKLVLFLLSMTMLVLVFSGCKDETTSTENGIDEVRIWTGASHSKEVYNRLVEEFNETIGVEKGIKIIYEVKEGSNITQMVELALQSNQAPEMFAGSRLATLSENGYIVALEDLPGGDELITKFKDYLREIYTSYQGKTYCLPFSATTRGLIYNKDMFKAAGIVDENGEPTPPKTFDELREYAKRLTNPEEKQYGIIYPLKWSGWFGSDVIELAMGSVGFNEYNPAAGEYNYDGYKPILECVLGIKEDNSYMPGAEGIDNDPARARFAEGNIGMKFAYSFDVGVLNDQFPAKCDWGVAPLPVVDTNNRYKQRYDLANVCRISQQGVEKVGAEKLMEVYKWLHSDEMAIELYKAGVSIPYNWDLVKDVEISNPKAGWVEFCKMTEISALEPVGISVDISGELILKDNFINKVWVGEMSIDEAIAIQNKLMEEGVKKYAELHPEYDASKFIFEDWDVSMQ